MKKNTLKYFIDVTIFIDMCSVTAIGLLLGFVIPKGSSVDKYFLGLHRHEWGDIHLYLALFLLMLLIFHVWLNWSWIMNATRRYFGERWKHALYAFSFGWVAVLFVSWIAVKLS